MQVVVNADDFGWDEEANKAILALCEAGKLQGVSIMANFASENSLKKIAQYQQTVRLGLHVVLNEGYPVAPPSEVYSLLDFKRDGQFYTSQVLWQRYVTGQINKQHIFEEIKAQIGRLREYGIHVTHADSHQHIHHFPFLGRVILQAMMEFGISSVRNSQPLERNDRRRKLLAAFCALTHRYLAKFSHNDVLVTYLASGIDRPEEAFLQRVLQQLASKNVQNVELMCHPALADRPDSYLRRRAEYEFLMSVNSYQLTVISDQLT